MSKYPWTKEYYRKVLANYNLTQEQAAEMLGATGRSGQRWALEAPPYMVCLIFQLMEEFEMLPEDIDELAHERGLR